MSTQQIIESWEAGVEPYNATATKRLCDQCKRDMGNEWILGHVCGKCCRKNHAKATGKKISGA